MPSAVQKFGLPTGPGRQEVELRRPTAPGARHDCFSSTELILLATASGSLSREDEAHLLGGLGSGCPTCWGAIREAKESLLEDLDFVDSDGAEIEFLRALTVYPLEALPLPLRLAVEGAHQQGILGVLALLVESAAALWRDDPRRLLGELEHARSLMGTEEGWEALGCRIDVHCAMAWMEVEDVPAAERKQRARTFLKLAMQLASATKDRELLAAATAAWTTVEPSNAENALRGAAKLLSKGNPLRLEFLLELAELLASRGRLQEAFETTLQAVGEANQLPSDFPILQLAVLHHFSIITLAMAQKERDQPPYFGLYLSLASVGHALSRDLLEWADENLETEIRVLGQELSKVWVGYGAA